MFMKGSAVPHPLSTLEASVTTSRQLQEMKPAFSVVGSWV